MAPGVEPRGHQVAQQDGVAHALIHRAEVADEEGDEADKHAVEQLALGGERAGHVVRRHKDSTEQKTAGHTLDQGGVGTAGVERSQHKDRGNDGHGDGGLDGPGGNQIGEAQQDGQHADLAHHAAVEAQKDVQQGQRGLVGHGQRRGGGQRVNGHVGVDIGSHAGGEAKEQHDTAHQCGVGEVVANPAEQLLRDDDGDERADNGDPERHAHGHVQRQNDAGDNGGQVAHGVGLFQQLFINVLKRHTGQGGHSDQHQRLHAEDQTRGQHGGQQRNDNIAHQPAGGGCIADMRRGGNDQTIFHGLFASFPQLGHVPALGKAHRLADGALGRAGIGAAAAGYAEIHAACLQRSKVLVGKVLRNDDGLQTHWAGLDAAPAADAGGRLGQRGGLLAEQQQAVVLLEHREVGAGCSAAHHRAAEDDLAQLDALLDTAAGVDDVAVQRADGHLDVLGLGDGVALDGDALRHQRDAGLEELAQRGDARHVHDDAAHVGGQARLAGRADLRHLAPGAGLDERFLGTLRVAHRQALDLDALHLASQRGEQVDALGLVAFNADAGSRSTS